MKNKKIPLRKCIACNERKDKRDLIRLVKNKENEIFLDTKGKINGRGAYICKNTECLDKAFKSKALNRAFKCNVSQEVYNTLKEELYKDE